MPITLTGLQIWNGRELADADTIQIEADKIAWIGHRDDVSATPSEIISCDGLTAIPGLIDAHVHLELNPDDAKAPNSTKQSVIPLMYERAEKMLQSGITTARDLGGGAWFELALRDKIASGESTGPRLLCSGQPITSPKGHCHFWGGEAENLEAAHNVLRRQVSKGVDLIKVMATGGRLTKGSEPTDAQFSQSDLSSIVELAHEHNLPIAAHCHGTEGIHRAARAGVDTIEHCSWLGESGWASDYQDDIAKIIVEQGAWVSPTVNKGWQRMLDSKTGNVLARVRTAYKKMLELGIPMVASTDAGIPGVYHHELPQALVVFAKIAELDNEHALRTATSDAARALGVDAFTGTLETNKAADILIVDGDPLKDLTAITRPVKVFAQGRLAA